MDFCIAKIPDFENRKKTFVRRPIVKIHSVAMIRSKHWSNEMIPHMSHHRHISHLRDHHDDRDRLSSKLPTVESVHQHRTTTSSPTRSISHHRCHSERKTLRKRREFRLKLRIMRIIQQSRDVIHRSTTRHLQSQEVARCRQFRQSIIFITTVNRIRKLDSAHRRRHQPPIARCQRQLQRQQQCKHKRLWWKRKVWAAQSAIRWGNLSVKFARWVQREKLRRKRQRNGRNRLLHQSPNTSQFQICHRRRINAPTTLLTVILVMASSFVHHRHRPKVSLNFRKTMRAIVYWKTF